MFMFLNRVDRGSVVERSFLPSLCPSWSSSVSHYYNGSLIITLFWRCDGGGNRKTCIHIIICQVDLLSPRCVWSGLKGKNEHLEINARFWFSTVEHKVSGILKTATFYPMWDLTFFVWSTMVKLTIILIWRNERRASEHLFCISQNLIRIEVIEEVNVTWMENVVYDKSSSLLLLHSQYCLIGRFGFCVRWMVELCGTIK